MSERFGLLIQRQLDTWFHQVMVPNLQQKYGDDVEVSVVILDPARVPDPSDPCSTGLYFVSVGDETRISAEEGLTDNVDHKLRFVLRTGLPSSEAALRPDLVEPGDFPWAGAGTYRDYTGGASGLKEESDWWVFCRVVDHVIHLRTDAALRPIQACKERRPGWKYLEGEVL
ncbi:MAG TPA: hypothetical protein VLF21_00760 [Candidatus Saccharimonadales bacterium]|nr:hypothetical protein [Candidatus Saccharimonadales bacterium]